MRESLRIGIIGASPKRGWANISHVPAVQGLTGIELAGVTGRDQKAADEAAMAFGAGRGFADTDSMIRDADIDVVTIAVRVPSHRELVLEALAAGKHVFCEWPLGRDVAEAEQLRDAAVAAGVHVVIGLQTRGNPTLHRARELVSSGAIGQVLSARLYSGTVAFGRHVDEADFYLEDVANGATLVSIHGGHAIDAAIAILGPLADVAALASVQYPEIDVGTDARRYHRANPDHLYVHSNIETGGVVAIEVDGGRPSHDTHFSLKIVGDRGGVELHGGAPRGFQSGRLSLSLNGEVQAVDEGEVAKMPDTAANVACIYAALRDDIVSGAATVPDFDHAVRLTRLISDVSRAAESGNRRVRDHWPQQ